MVNISTKLIRKLVRTGISLYLAIIYGLVLSTTLLFIGCRDMTNASATSEYTERETVMPVKENDVPEELPDMQNLILTQNDADQSFTVKQGDIIEIELEENLSTGYEWEIDEINYEVVVLESSDSLPIQELAPGTGGTRHFRFRAYAAGTTSIKLKYWQPWEGNNSIVEHFNVTISVAD